MRRDQMGIGLGAAILVLVMACGSGGAGSGGNDPACSWPADLKGFATRHLLTCDGGSSPCFTNVVPTTCPATAGGNAVAACTGVCNCVDVCQADEYAVEITPMYLDGPSPTLPSSCRAAPGVELSSDYSYCCKCE